jgi:hypothetical protein
VHCALDGSKTSLYVHPLSLQLFCNKDLIHELSENNWLWIVVRGTTDQSTQLVTHALYHKAHVIFQDLQVHVNVEALLQPSATSNKIQSVLRMFPHTSFIPSIAPLRDLLDRSSHTFVPWPLSSHVGLCTQTNTLHWPLLYAYHDWFESSYKNNVVRIRVADFMHTWALFLKEIAMSIRHHDGQQRLTSGQRYCPSSIFVFVEECSLAYWARQFEDCCYGKVQYPSTSSVLFWIANNDDVTQSDNVLRWWNWHRPGQSSVVIMPSWRDTDEHIYTHDILRLSQIFVSLTLDLRSSGNPLAKWPSPRQRCLTCNESMNVTTLVHMPTSLCRPNVRVCSVPTEASDDIIEELKDRKFTCLPETKEETLVLMRNARKKSEELLVRSCVVARSSQAFTETEFLQDVLDRSLHGIDETVERQLMIRTYQDAGLPVPPEHDASSVILDAVSRVDQEMRRQYLAFESHDFLQDPLCINLFPPTIVHDETARHAVDDVNDDDTDEDDDEEDDDVVEYDQANALDVIWQDQFVPLHLKQETRRAALTDQLKSLLTTNMDLAVERGYDTLHTTPPPCCDICCDEEHVQNAMLACGHTMCVNCAEKCVQLTVRDKSIAKCHFCRYAYVDQDGVCVLPKVSPLMEIIAQTIQACNKPKQQIVCVIGSMHDYDQLHTFIRRMQDVCTIMNEDEFTEVHCPYDCQDVFIVSSYRSWNNEWLTQMVGRCWSYHQSRQVHIISSDGSAPTNALQAWLSSALAWDSFLGAPICTQTNHAEAEC